MKPDKSAPDNQAQKEAVSSNGIGSSLSIGLSLGVLFGIVTDNIGLGMMLGGAAGALPTWLFYRPLFDLEENPDTIRGVFCTAPAVRNPASNLLSEIIATFVLIFTIFYITEGHLSSTEGNVPIGLGSVGALPVALVILVIGGA